MQASPEATENPYPGSSKFSDEGGTGEKGNLVYFIRNYAAGEERQFDFFVPEASHGLTPAGLVRLNQSIEAFIYCVLGSQVNTKSSILDFTITGNAEEAQGLFLGHIEKAIILLYMTQPKALTATRIPSTSQRFGSTWQSPGNLAHALEPYHEHGECRWLQQQAQTRGGWDEARCEQRCEHKHKIKGFYI